MFKKGGELDWLMDCMCTGERRIKKVSQVLELSNLVNCGAICGNGVSWMRN